MEGARLDARDSPTQAHNGERLFAFEGRLENLQGATNEGLGHLRENIGASRSVEFRILVYPNLHWWSHLSSNTVLPARFQRNAFLKDLFEDRAPFAVVLCTSKVVLKLHPSKVQT